MHILDVLRLFIRRQN